MLPMQPQLSLLMETKIFLYGASGHGKVIADIISNQKGVEMVFIDDSPKYEEILNVPVLNRNTVQLSLDSHLIVSIGNNWIRKEIVNRLQVSYATVIHHTAVISSYSSLNEGTVVMAGVLVNPNAKIGKHCILNTGAIIEHDCKISDFVHISPGVSLAGNVSIGEGTHVGIGSTIIQNVTVGKWATIGAGAVILKDVPDYAVVVGNPGKVIKFNTFQ